MNGGGVLEMATQDWWGVQSGEDSCDILGRSTANVAGVGGSLEIWR